MGCIFALFAAFAPRLALLFIWIFTPLVNRAFGFFLWPLLGLIFLPFTTLIYVLLYSPLHHGIVGWWNWIWILLALLLDLGTYIGGGYRRNSYTYP